MLQYNWRFLDFQALLVLSRAVENNPASIAIWTVYLLVFYSYTTTREKDDMFSYAVCFKFVPCSTVEYTSE